MDNGHTVISAWYTMDTDNSWSYTKRYKDKRKTYCRRWIHDIENWTGLTINMAAEQSRKTDYNGEQWSIMLLTFL